MSSRARERTATQGGGKRTFPLALSPVNHTVTPFWERRLERSSAFTEPIHPAASHPDQLSDPPSTPRANHTLQDSPAWKVMLVDIL